MISDVATTTGQGQPTPQWICWLKRVDGRLNRSKRYFDVIKARTRGEAMHDYLTTTVRDLPGAYWENVSCRREKV